MAQLNFNANDVQETNDFEVIPAGIYSAQIIASEMKETKAKTGMYLELRIQILDEEHRGRLIFERLNLVNPNETAVSIAQRDLASICRACGVLEVEDSEELHGIEMSVQVVVTPPRGEWAASNEVKKYMAA